YLPRMKYILEGIHSSSDCRCFFPEEIIQKYHIKGLLMEIVNEFTGKKYGYDFLINADLQKLFTYLIRIWISEGYTIPKRQVPKYELSSQTSHPKLGHKACINAGWETNQLIS
ncbi:MAG: hypothetical protein PUI16_04950, partial [Clostridia bacterium]|nr:hypothetical protein [Clostridia bacterium]MDY5553981.1 hypothetical protein [Blautia sp.]